MPFPLLYSSSSTSGLLSVSKKRLLFPYPLNTSGSGAGQTVFTGVTTPTNVMQNAETYDLAAVLLTLGNGNILNNYTAGYRDAHTVIALQQTANGGGSWTPYSGSVQGGGTLAQSGTVNTAGTAVTWVSGNKFDGGTPATITINGVPFGVSSIPSQTSMVLSTSAGTQTGVSYVYPAIAGAFYTALPTLEAFNSTAMLTLSGAVVLFWQTDTGVSGSFNFLAYSSRSTDNGATWSAAAQMPAGYGIPTNGNCVVIPGGGVCPAYPNGILFVPIINSALNSTVLMQSTDDGVTWTVGPTIGNLGPIEECSVAWAGGNTLIGFCRNSSGTVAGTTPMKFLYSTNMGVSWTITNSNIDLTQTTPPGSSGLFLYTIISPFIINSSPASKQMTLLFTERSSWNGISPSGYGRIRAISFDPLVAIANPTSFPIGQLIDSSTAFSIVDIGYPSAANISGSNYLLQWGKNKTVGCFSCQAQYQATAVYNPPSVSLKAQAVSPSGGLLAGGTPVTIVGEGFQAGATVTFGGVAATSVVVVSPGVITCVTPANSSTGVINVVVTSGGVGATIVNAFTYSNIQLIASAVTTTADTPSNTATINSTGATLLVVLVAGFNPAITLAVTDSLGNTWVEAPDSGETTCISTPRIFYAYSHAAGALATGSVHVITTTSSSYCGGSVYAFSGTNTTSAVFGQGVGAGNSNLSSPISSTSIVSPTVGDILLCGVMANQSMNSPVVSGNGDGNTWSSPLGTGSDVSTQAFWASYAIAQSPTTSTPKWTISGVTQATEVMASFHSA